MASGSDRPDAGKPEAAGTPADGGSPSRPGIERSDEAPEAGQPQPHLSKDVPRDAEGHPFGAEGTNKVLPTPEDSPGARKDEPLSSDGKHVERTPHLR